MAAQDETRYMIYFTCIYYMMYLVCIFNNTSYFETLI